MKLVSFTDTHIEKNEPVLVFGNLGISRCVTVIVAYLMHHFKQSLEVSKHTCNLRNLRLNVTFNNISVIMWWSVLLVEKQEDPEKTSDLPQVTDKLYHLMYRVCASPYDHNHDGLMFKGGQIQPLD